MTDTPRFDTDSIPHAENVGAWLLGALDDETARDFAAELERSPRLRAQVAQLQPVVNALPMGAPQVDPPPALRDRIMATVREEADLQRAAAGEPRQAAPAPAAPPARERRRFFGLRPLTAAGFACVVLAVGVGAGIVLSNGGDSGTGATTIEAKVSFVNASGRLIDHGKDGGQLELTGIPNPKVPGHVYQVWLMKKGATKPTPTDALFSPRGNSKSTVSVPGNLDEVDQVLVTEEPAGGSPQPTTEPQIAVTL